MLRVGTNALWKPTFPIFKHPQQESFLSEPANHLWLTAHTPFRPPVSCLRWVILWLAFSNANFSTPGTETEGRGFPLKWVTTTPKKFSENLRRILAMTQLPWRHFSVKNPMNAGRPCRHLISQNYNTKPNNTGQTCNTSCISTLFSQTLLQE